MKYFNTKKKIVLLTTPVILSLLIIQAYVLADPSSPPPGGNITPQFTTANFSDNVGIGNSTPSELLVVGDDLGNLATGNYSVIGGPINEDLGLYIGSTSGKWLRFIYSKDAYDFFIETSNGTTTNDSQIMLDADSPNVAIGNSTPTAKLSVGNDIGPLSIGTAVTVGPDDGKTNAAFAAGESSNLYGVMQWDQAYKNLRLFAIDSGGSGNTLDQLVLEGGTGNVGIQTPIPFAPFQVGNTSLTPDTDFTATHPSMIAIAEESASGNPAIWFGQQQTNRSALNYSNADKELTFSLRENASEREPLTISSDEVNVGDGNGGILSLGQPPASFAGDYPIGIFVGNTQTGSKPNIRLAKDDTTFGQMLFDSSNNQLAFEIQTLNGPEPVAQMKASNTEGPRMGIGIAPDNEIPLSVEDNSLDYVAKFRNSAANGKGLWIEAADYANTATMISFADNGGAVRGTITRTNDTVSYNAFTGSHISTIPQNNKNGYEYGTIMSLKNVITTENSKQPNYHSEPTTKAYDSNIFGVYSSIYPEEENLHQIFAVGDGHVLVTTENGSIKEGDPITSSNLEGLGMKAIKAGTILGYALENWDGSQTSRTETLADGTQVKVGLVAVYYYPGTKYTPDQETRISSLEEKIARLEETLATLTN